VICALDLRIFGMKHGRGAKKKSLTVQLEDIDPSQQESMKVQFDYRANIAWHRVPSNLCC
jgi:hypothetical protein